MVRWAIYDDAAAGLKIVHDVLVNSIDRIERSSYFLV